MNKIRSKAFVALLVVAMLVAQTVLPSFAADTAAEIKYPCSSGKHEVTETELKNAIVKDDTLKPTCSQDGYVIYECPKKDCKGDVTVTVPATGVHTGNGKIVNKVEATCTKEGTKAYQLCTGCGAFLDENGKYIGNTEKSLVIPKTAHKYVLKSDVAAECTTAGYKEYECSDCKATKITNKVNPLGHNYVWKDGKEPNCVEPGYTKYKECSRCGDIDPQNPKTEIPVVDHNLKVTLKTPTCTEKGSRTFKCENPDCTYFTPRVEEIPALGHTFKDHAAKAATCTDDGNKAYKECTVCHKYFASDAKADSTDYKSLSDFKENKKGHKPVSTGYIAPTCTEEGTTGDIKCVTCGKILRKGEVLAKVPHEFGELVQAKTPTCTEKGNVEYKDCKNCKQHFDKDGKVLETVEIPENGHTLRITTKEATCTEVGYKITTCDVCDYTVSETIPAAGHKFKTVAEVAPTCEEKGTKEHKVCTVCEKLFAKDAKVDSKSPIEARDLVIKEKGHVKEDVAKVIPTLSKYLETADLDTEYVAKFDLDKDGYITFMDLDLLRKAIVGNNEFLDITVDPNAPAQEVTPEV